MTGLSKPYFRFRRFTLMVQMKKLICLSYNSSTSSWKLWRWGYNKVFSISPFADLFVFGDFDIHHKVWEIYSGGTNRTDSCLFLLTFLQTQRWMLLSIVEFLIILVLIGPVFLIIWEIFHRSLNLVLPLMLHNSVSGSRLELMLLLGCPTAKFGQLLRL